VEAGRNLDTFSYVTVTQWSNRMAHTTIRVFGDVSRLGVDDSLDEGLQVLILGK
jgi:hypothetical protein